MENEKFQVNMGALPKAELIIRETTTVNELPVKPPVVPNIKGVPGTVAEYLLKRRDYYDQIYPPKCHVLINRENLTITLVINEDDQYLTGKVTEVLEIHPKMKEFGINTGKEWEPNELGQFFKMNRAFFADMAENMKLVTDLKNFKATVDSKIEKQKSDKGDFNDSYSGVVNSNLPGTFKLKIPIFKGRQKEYLEVEFWASVSGRDVSLKLVSPGANMALEEVRDVIFDEQKAAIAELAPGIAIIEQ